MKLLVTTKFKGKHLVKTTSALAALKKLAAVLGPVDVVDIVAVKAA